MVHEKKMTKVGLVTYDGNNYGGCLQAFALQQTLLEAGCDARIISKRLPLKNSNYNLLRRLWKAVLDPAGYFQRRKYILRHTANDRKFRNRAFERFRQERLSYEDRLTLNSENPGTIDWSEYRSFVCGSDQIWNPNLYGVDPFWTLQFVPKGCKKIAYAPSLGVSSVAPKWHPFFREALADFDYLSVREREGAKCLSEILHRQVDTVLDPTLLVSAEKWRSVMRPAPVEGPYVFCYLFGSMPYIAKVKERVKKISGLPIVSCPYHLRELTSDDILLYDIAPDQFVWLIANASLVLTDSFHATAFSINLRVPFVSLTRSPDTHAANMNSRLYTLLQKTRLEERLICESDMERLEQTVLRSVDFSIAGTALAEAAAGDREKLYDALRNE